MEDCKRIADLLSDYLDEEIEPEFRRQVDAHMADCPPCVEFFKELRTTVAATQDHRIECVPPEVKERLHDFLMSRISDRGQG